MHYTLWVACYRCTQLAICCLLRNGSDVTLGSPIFSSILMGARSTLPLDENYSIVTFSLCCWCGDEEGDESNKCNISQSKLPETKNTIYRYKETDIYM